MRFFYFKNNQINIQIHANHKLVIFDTNIFINASSVFFLFNKAKTDLNSGQLVKVANTKNQINHFGAFDASAVKLTIGSRKYQLISNIIIQSGKYNLLTVWVSSVTSSCSNFLVNKYILIKKEKIIQ